VALQIAAVGRSDIGLVRPGNEDSLHLDDKSHVYAVCDGMGGHQAGEVASMTAADVLQKSFGHFGAELLNDPNLTVGRTLPPGGELLLKAIRLANRTIYVKALGNPALTGMGTTIVSVALEADIMSIAHVGDSRAYRLTEHGLEPLTRDHSWVAEMQTSHNISAKEAGSVVGRNVITRALGVRPTVEVDFRIVKVKPGERFMLCSDGLCGFADDDEIFDAARPHLNDLTKIVESLIQLANDRGGSDNVTVVALEIRGVQSSPLPELDLFTLKEESEETGEAENRWIVRFAEAETESPPNKATGGSGANKFILLTLVLAFMAVAAAIIWYFPGK
jgi:serine/threonine protein phosphatase PrpC